MGESKHTPYISTGPYDRKIDGPPRITTRLTAGLATVAYFERQNEAESVAAKLEAFPLMLEALRRSLPMLEQLRLPGPTMSGAWGPPSDLIADVRAAIKAATGGDQ